MNGLQITTPEVSPLTILPSKAPRSPLPKKLPIAPQNTTPKSNEFIKIKQCNIGTILAKESKDSFLNAIFDYGIYKKQLHIIYNRLIGLYFFIISKKINEKDEKDIEEINKIYKDKDKIINKILDINIKKHFDYSQINLLNNKIQYYTNSDNNKCAYIIFTHNDTQINKELYDAQLRQFIYFMIFIQDIYIHTLGKNNFLNDIKNYLNTKDAKIFSKAGWDVFIINTIIDFEKIHKNTSHDDSVYHYSILKKYTTIANNNNIINIKIIEKIFSKEILNMEPFYIIHTKIKFPYNKFAGKTAMFNFFKKVNNKKNYIRIMQDSNNEYFNIFSIEEDDNYMIT